MITTAYFSPTTATGTATDPGNVLVSDDSWAIINNFQTVIATDFKFNTVVPTGTAILGIEALVEMSTLAGGTWAVNVNLHNTSTIGSNRSTTFAGGTDVPTAFGGEGDVWGATLTPSIVNSSTFGCRITANRISGGSASSRLRVDHIQMRVTYEILATPGAPTPVDVVKVNVAGTFQNAVKKVKINGVFI